MFLLYVPFKCLVRLTSYKERPSPISPASYYGDLSVIFRWGILSGFVLMNSQLERFTCFIYQDLNLLLLLVSVCSTAGSLDGHKQHNFPLSSAASIFLKYTESRQHSESGKTETSPSGRPAKKLEYWTCESNFSLPRKSPGVSGFPPTCSILSWREGLLWGACWSKPLPLFSVAPNKALFCQHEIQAKQKPVQWAAASQNDWTLDICLHLLFPSPERSWELRVFSQSHHNTDWGKHLWQRMPPIFLLLNVDGFKLASGAKAS